MIFTASLCFNVGSCLWCFADVTTTKYYLCYCPCFSTEKIMPTQCLKPCISTYLVALDEYLVENFHSILRARTNGTDSAEQIAFKAKEIDICKHELHSFKSVFVPAKTINVLKAKAAKFLTSKFEYINNHLNMATQQPRVKRQPKHLTKWSLPKLFGQKIVNNRVLPLDFTSVQQAPNPTR